MPDSRLRTTGTTRFTKAAKSTPKATMAGTTYTENFAVPPGTRARL